MSFPALLGVLAYTATAVLGGLARQRSGDGFWLFVAAFFVALVFWRIAGAEDAIRDALRSHLELRDLYTGRRAVQTGFAASLAIAGAAGMLVLWRRRRRILANRWLSEAAMLGLMGLIAIRLVSLSPIDRLLYGGPVHLNWFLEGGLVALCAYAAFREWRANG